METKMFGFPIFELETNDPSLKNIPEMNIRKDATAYTLTNYKDMLH